MTTQWQQDLSLAAEHQELVRCLLDERASKPGGYWVTAAGYEPDQDLTYRWAGGEHRVECKEDFKAYQTGNLAVEVASEVRTVVTNKSRRLADIVAGRRPSGITRTRAQSVVYTSHLMRPGAKHQVVDAGEVWCTEVTWRMTPEALLKAIENWAPEYQVWRVDTHRDPGHTASCHIVENANAFIDKAPGLVVLNTAPCRHPWRHFE